MGKQTNLIAASVLAALLGLAGCGTAAATGTGPGVVPPATAPVSVGAAPAMNGSGNAMAGMIHIDSGAFRDATPVLPGSMVTVMNMDPSAYTFTSDDGHSFSVTVPAGAMVGFKAPGRPGSYPFHCGGKAGSMRGVLTVR